MNETNINIVYLVLIKSVDVSPISLLNQEKKTSLTLFFVLLNQSLTQSKIHKTKHFPSHAFLIDASKKIGKNIRTYLHSYQSMYKKKKKEKKSLV